jgi:uncharacterized membrane protein
MSADFGGFMNAIFGIAMLGFVGTLAVVILVVFVVIRAVRRNGVAADPAEEELRGRLARGDIDMAEFEVRLRALRNGDAF